MLVVTSLDGTKIEPLSKYNQYERHEEVSGTLELSFTSFSVHNNPGYELLKEEAIITDQDGYDYRIKQIGSNDKCKPVKALSTYFDLVGTRKYDIFGGTKTLNQFLDWTLAGTGWTYINLDVTHSALVPNFGNDNVVKLNNALLSAFDCEMKIGPNKTLIFAKKIGPDNDAQYRYGHNIRALSHHVDTTKLRTRIKGFGGDGLEVTYTSPNVDKFGLRDADPVEDDRYTVTASMVDRLKQELIDYPETSIELDAIELQDKEIGERVWLIYEPLGIEFQTRVMAKTDRIPKAKSSVVLGNIKQSMSDILTQTKIEIDENKKEFRSKIEQTNDRITLEVEEVNESIAAIEVRADDITLSVQTLGGRVDSAESQINIQAGQISQKVSYTDYNGNTIASLINQTSTTIKLQAERIEFEGQVFGEGATFTGDLVGGSIKSDTTIDVTTDLRVGNNIYIGNPNNGLSKRLYFNNSTYISGNDQFMQVFALETWFGGSVYSYGSKVVTESNGVANDSSKLGGVSASSYSRTNHNHNGTYARVTGSYDVWFEITSAGNLNVYRNGSYFKTITM